MTFPIVLPELAALIDEKPRKCKDQSKRGKKDGEPGLRRVVSKRITSEGGGNERPKVGRPFPVQLYFEFADIQCRLERSPGSGVSLSAALTCLSAKAALYCSASIVFFIVCKTHSWVTIPTQISDRAIAGD